MKELNMQSTNIIETHKASHIHLSLTRLNIRTENSTTKLNISLRNIGNMYLA